MTTLHPDDPNVLIPDMLKPDKARTRQTNISHDSVTGGPVNPDWTYVKNPWKRATATPKPLISQVRARLHTAEVGGSTATAPTIYGP